VRRLLLLSIISLRQVKLFVCSNNGVRADFEIFWTTFKKCFSKKITVFLTLRWNLNIFFFYENIWGYFLVFCELTGIPKFQTVVINWFGTLVLWTLSWNKYMWCFMKTHEVTVCLFFVNSLVSQNFKTVVISWFGTLVLWTLSWDKYSWCFMKTHEVTDFLFCELTGIPKLQKKLISLDHYFITKI